MASNTNDRKNLNWWANRESELTNNENIDNSIDLGNVGNTMDDDSSSENDIPQKKKCKILKKKKISVRK